MISRDHAAGLLRTYLPITSWFVRINNINYRWYVFGPPGLTSYKLPDLPQCFTGVPPGSEEYTYHLYAVTLLNYPQFECYDDVVDVRSSSNYFYEVANLVRSRVKYYSDNQNIDKKYLNHNELDKIYY